MRRSFPRMLIRFAFSDRGEPSRTYLHGLSKGQGQPLHGCVNTPKKYLKCYTCCLNWVQFSIHLCSFWALEENQNNSRTLTDIIRTLQVYEGVIRKSQHHFKPGFFSTIGGIPAIVLQWCSCPHDCIKQKTKTNSNKILKMYHAQQNTVCHVFTFIEWTLNRRRRVLQFTSGWVFVILFFYFFFLWFIRFVSTAWLYCFTCETCLIH